MTSKKEPPMPLREKIRMWALTITGVAAAIVLVFKITDWAAWELWAQPKVDVRIECRVGTKLDKMNESIEFIASQQMKDMTMKEIQQLEREYAEYRNATGKAKKTPSE